MVRSKESVVTPERFAQGVGYHEYVASLEKRRDKYEGDYARFSLTPQEIAEFKTLAERPNGPAKVAVITEYWCPDCWREVPVAAKLAEAAGLELRVFARDEHLDIMEEFLHHGEFQSIPVFVFYTRDHRYIAHWIERSAAANEGMVEVRRIFEGRTREEAQPDYDTFQLGPVWDGWKHTTVRELIDLLEPKTR